MTRYRYTYHPIADSQELWELRHIFKFVNKWKRDYLFKIGFLHYCNSLPDCVYKVIRNLPQSYQLENKKAKRETGKTISSAGARLTNRLKMAWPNLPHIFGGRGGEGGFIYVSPKSSVCVRRWVWGDARYTCTQPRSPRA